MFSTINRHRGLAVIKALYLTVLERDMAQVKELKGGLSLQDSPFAKLYEMMQIPDSKFKFHDMVERAAENLGNQQLIRSAAFDASREGWREAGYFEWKWSSADVGNDYFGRWGELADTCLQWRREATEADTAVDEACRKAEHALIDLVELMSRWFDKLTDPMYPRNRGWQQECSMLLDVHKTLKRRFWEYKNMMGNEHPVIE